ncbi:MAG: hypothetical protein RL376_1172 [Verrucomicrobiota bacterium]|jgi:hypothetical protein
MQTQTLPPLALALGRLRTPRPAPRAWPFAPLPSTPPPAPEPAPRNDFLVVTLAPTLLKTATLDELPAIPEIPGAEAARTTYWFDL